MLKYFHNQAEPPSALWEERKKMKRTDYVPSFRELIESAPEKYGDKVFIRYRKGGEIADVRYSQLKSDTYAFCRMLRAEYPEKTHIAVFSRSCYEYIVAICGSMLSGNIIIPAAPDMNTADAAALIKQLDVTAVLYDSAIFTGIEEIKKECPAVANTLDLNETGVFERIYEKYSETSEFAALSDIEVDQDECALIISTSGTTGDRKGVMLSSAALVGNVFFTPYSDTITGSYDILSVLPLYHILCFVADFMGALKLGCTLCLNGDMRNLFENLKIFKPESMRIVPMIAQGILARVNGILAKNPGMDRNEAMASVTGGRLKVLLSGGAYLDPALSKAFASYGIFLRQGYGMSEAGCKVSVPDEDCDYESVGRLMNILDARIRDNEIQIDTPCRMIGYYKDEEATRAAFTEDGWLRTGDMGRLTEDGELFITGRVKNLIILSNGENVSPECIENRYRCHKLIKEVLVYAEKDMIIAEIFPDCEYAEHAGIENITAEIERITDELNMNALPSHTVAKFIVRTEPLEKTATGKIKRVRA